MGQECFTSGGGDSRGVEGGQCSLFQLIVLDPGTSEAQLPTSNTNSLWQVSSQEEARVSSISLPTIPHPKYLREELWIFQRNNLLAGCPPTQPSPSQQRGGQRPKKAVSPTAGKQVLGILFLDLKERTVLGRIAQHIQNSRALPRFESVVLEVSEKCRSSFQLTLLNFKFYYEKLEEARS